MDDRQADYALLNTLEQQTQFAVFARADLQRALAVDDTHRVWFSIHALIHVAGVVSLLLWPDPRKANGESNSDHQERAGRYAERARRIRERLQVGDESPLWDRALRHNVEHFDERIHRWADVLDEHHWVYPVEAIRNYSEFDSWPEAALQDFDYNSYRLRIADDVFDLADLGYRLERLNTRVRRLARHPYRGADLSELLPDNDDDSSLI